MQTRARVLMGWVLVTLPGCQSYFPNSHGGGSPYSAIPPGTYAPASGTSVQGGGRIPPPTSYQPGRAPQTAGGQMPAGSPPLKESAPASGGAKSVPVYSDPSEVPGGLGTPLDDPDGESIRRPTSSRDNFRRPTTDLNDESEEVQAALGEEDAFAPPQKLQSTSSSRFDDDMPRVARKAEPNPYKRHESYAWLMGRVARDSQGRGWRLRYSDDPADVDRYDGSLLIVGNEKIEQLLDDDVIRVYGRIDSSQKDPSGKPVYRVDRLQRMKPKL